MHTLASRRYLLVVLLVLTLIALLAISTFVLPAVQHTWVHGLASGSTPDFIKHNH